MRKDELLKSSDIISIHLVLGDRYQNRITQKELGLMKKLIVQYFLQ
jgi:lactate dehydrogenase-like 2-hydroxyacid dehydrogenase